MTFATFAGYASGLTFVAPALDGATTLGTSATMLVCDAVVCRLFARNNGYPRNLWTALGLIGGLWAVAVLILLPRRAGAPALPGQLP